MALSNCLPNLVQEIICRRWWNAGQAEVVVLNNVVAQLHPSLSGSLLPSSLVSREGIVQDKSLNGEDGHNTAVNCVWLLWTLVCGSLVVSIHLGEDTLRVKELEESLDRFNQLYLDF